MKTILGFSIMLALFGGIFFTKARGSNPKPDGPARSYEYQYSGTMMYPITFYDVKRDDSGAVRIAYMQPDWGHDTPEGPDVLVIPGPADFFERVDAIVAKYKLHRLKGTYTPRADIRDGYMWHAYIRFQNNSISAGGSNAYPSAKLWSGIEAINDYIQELIDASSEADVVFRQKYREYRNR